MEHLFVGENRLLLILISISLVQQNHSRYILII